MVTEKISNLLDQYFDLAFEEGREGRFYDTEAGDAQRVRSELEAALSTDAEPVAELQSVNPKEFDEAIQLLPSVMRPSLSKVIIAAIEEQRQIIAYFKRTSRARQLAFEAVLQQQPAPSVAVKALEWDGTQAEAVTGGYWIVNATKKWLYRQPYAKLADFDTIEEAKAEAQADYEARVRSALASQAQVQDVAAPEGWQLVPKEPTEEMFCRGDDQIIDHLNSNKIIEGETTPAQDCYRAMLAAAPAADAAAIRALQSEER